MRSATQPSRALRGQLFLKQIVQACLLPPVSPASTRVPHTSPLRPATTRARDAGVHEALDAEQFTDLVQAYDEVSRLDLRRQHYCQ